MYAKRSGSCEELWPGTPTRRLCLSLIPDLTLTLFVVALIAWGSHFIYQAEYVGGLQGAGVGQSLLLAPELKPLIVFITLGIVVPITVIRLLKKRVSLTHRLLRLAFPAVCVAALFAPVRVLGPEAAVYLRGFERRMLEKVDIDAVQRWLAAEGERHAGRTYQDDFPSELPVCLTEFEPGEILFSDIAAGGGMVIEFRWYAPHGENYGLVVGPPSMESPAESVIPLPDSDFNEFRRPIKPGAYVFARG
ncbi:MAG: hypothetical protein ACM3VT_01900 [Solirubrobacterales bacterium]